MDKQKYVDVPCEADRCIHIAPMVDGKPDLGKLVADTWEPEHAKLIVDALNNQATLTAQVGEYQKQIAELNDSIGVIDLCQVKPLIDSLIAQRDRLMEALKLDRIIEMVGTAQRAWAEQDAYPTPYGFAKSFNEHLALMIHDNIKALAEIEREGHA